MAVTDVSFPHLCSGSSGCWLRRNLAICPSCPYRFRRRPGAEPRHPRCEFQRVFLGLDRPILASVIYTPDVARLSRQTGIPILPRIVPSPGARPRILSSRRRTTKGPSALETTNAILCGRRQQSAALRRLAARSSPGRRNLPAAGGSQPARIDRLVGSGRHIQDKPRFAWRGLSLDVSRHFIPLDGVKRTIDGLAAVSSTCSTGTFRTIRASGSKAGSIPRFQQVGSDGQFYTQAEVRDVIAYARDRGVRIVPEFDIPGHATSWLPGYPDAGEWQGTVRDCAFAWRS